jgi:signal transduction histidine kinase
MLVKAEGRYQHLTQQIFNLVGPGSVHLFLGCPDSQLRHPLLDLLSAPNYHSVACTGSPDTIPLLQNEHIRALCDLAIQTGQVQTVDQWQSYIYDNDHQSIAVAPLERPAGILGFFLLTAPHINAFYHGERLLLHHYLPQVAQNLENDLRSLSSNLSHPSSNEFISMVSHELRTPLTAIKGYAVLLQAYSYNSSEDGSDELMTPLRQQEYLDIIMEQANHLEVLISDLLDVSRLHAGRMHLRCSHIDAPQLCRRVIRLIQQRVDHQYPGRYEITCMVDPDFPLVWADADRVQQILTNLLENAVKYSPNGGLIEVIASLFPPNALLETDIKRDIALPQEPSVYISIRDQGIGISLEQQTRLFKPFSRLEHVLTIDVPGAGLGLYITRKLVEAMGGKITLHSNEGAGTSVIFTLPVKAVQR